MLRSDSQHRSTLTLVAAVTLLTACGSDPPGPQPLESLASCTGNWQPFTAPAPYDYVSPLVRHEGALYYSLDSTQMIHRLSDAGAVTNLAPYFARELWIEGDHIFFTSGNYNDQFFRVPVNGGTPELLLEGGAGRTERGAALLHLHTRDELFWSETSPVNIDHPPTFWRASRTDLVPVEIGRAQAVLEASQTLNYSKMALASDGLVLGSILGLAEVLPFGGGQRRPLALLDRTTRGLMWDVAVGADGAYWSVAKQDTLPEDDWYDVVLAPADGGPVQPFWTDLPARSFISEMWPDGTGGWIAAGYQTFDDNRSHVTIWTRGADGRARRLACSPDAIGGARIESRPASDADAVYVVSVVNSQWRLVRVGLNPS
jgi:hypothetical protein